MFYQPDKNGFAKRRGDSLQSATDRRFVHAQEARDLGQGTSIEIITGQNEFVFPRQSGEGLVRGLFQARVVRLRRVTLCGPELGSSVRLLLQADQALLPPKAVHILLRQDGTKPALKGAAAGKRVEFRDSPAVR